MAKAAGIYTLFMRDPSFFSWTHLILACAATAIGFLFGEKLLLFATLSQITSSIFGSVLFLSLGVLWMPLLLHFACVLIVAISLKAGGKKGFLAGLFIATVLHCFYNLYFILGGSGEYPAHCGYRKKRVPRTVFRKDDPFSRVTPGLHCALLFISHGRAHIHVRSGIAFRIFTLPVQYRVRGK